MINLILDAMVLGIGATAVMDAIAQLQRHFFGIPSLNYSMVGRWIGYLCGGKFIHTSICKSTPIHGELLCGWIAHYMIGIAFAGLFLVIKGEVWLREPELLPALIFGLITVAAPFFVLQPGMGAGIAARKLPHPNKARMRSLIAHLSFGLGLWSIGVFYLEVRNIAG